MKLKIILCSLISMSMVASQQSDLNEQSVHKIDPRALEIQMVTVYIGSVRVQRPVTPSRTILDDEEYLARVQQRTENKQEGPIRRSLYSNDLAHSQAQDAFEARRKKMVLENKIRLDLYDIARRKYLEQLAQISKAHDILLAASSDKRAE